jgi:hypothetical protein
VKKCAAKIVKCEREAAVELGIEGIIELKRACPLARKTRCDVPQAIDGHVFEEVWSVVVLHVLSASNGELNGGG